MTFPGSMIQESVESNSHAYFFWIRKIMENMEQTMILYMTINYPSTHEKNMTLNIYPLVI